MLLLQDLRRLAAWPEGPEAVVSLFLDTAWSDEQQREKVRLFVSGQCKGAQRSLPPGVDADRGLAASLGFISSYTDALVRQATDVDARGVAVYACAPRGFFRVLRSRLPFEPMELRVGHRPYLRPLATLAGLLAPALVLAIDGRRTMIWELKLGEVALLDMPPPADVPGRHSRGGWQQLRYQHHLAEHRTHHLQEAERSLTQLSEHSPESELFLGGTHRETEALRLMLPKHVRARVAAEFKVQGGLDSKETQVEVLSRAARQVAVHAVERDRALADRIVSEAVAGGLAVVGAEDVILALNEGRVHRLMVERDYQSAGWRCRSCHAVGVRSSAGCGFCGAETTTALFPDELIRLALNQRAEVWATQHALEMHLFRGLGALIRHRGKARPRLGFVHPMHSDVVS